MSKFLRSILLLTAVFILPIQHLLAGPLTSAQVTKIINRVSVIDPAKGGHPASVREVIKDDLGLETGAKSRSELLFQDNTLTRIGAETFFSFKTGTRDMTLEKGSMLLQVPRGLGGAKIHTAAVTAAITGTTIMMEHIPNQYIKVLVLEGSLRLSRNGTFGDSLVLRPGKMVIMRPDAKKIPDPIDVDLQNIVATSSLVNFPGAEPLPSIPLIQAAIDSQHDQLVKKNLVPTNLVMGQGTNVTLIPTSPVSTSAEPTALPSANLSGGAISTVKGTLAALPIVGPVASNTLTDATTAVNNLLSSTGSTVGAVANDLLSTTSNVTSLAVSSSTQILSLLDTAVPSVGGTVAIVPTTLAAVTMVATAPTEIVTSTVGGVTTAVADTTGSVVDTVASTTGSVTTLATDTLSSLTTSTITSPSPTSTLTTVTSVPTSLVAGTVTGGTSSTGGLLGGFGH